MNPVLKAPGTKRLKLTYENQLSSLAFNFNLRRYTKAAFDAYIGDAATETWPVEDLLPLSLRATFLSASSGRKKMLLKWRRYAFPAAAFDLLVDRGGGRAPLSHPTPLIHPSFTPHTPLIHPSHTPHTPLIHTSYIPYTPLMRPSYTPNTPLRLTRW